MLFQIGTGDWTQYRKLQPSPHEINCHYERRGFGPRETSYKDQMSGEWDDALEALKVAFANGTKYILFIHGKSTSRPGRTTARSQIRALMRSKSATPYICRKECIQHDSVFLVVIKPNRNEAPIATE